MASWNTICVCGLTADIERDIRPIPAVAFDPRAKFIVAGHGGSEIENE